MLARDGLVQAGLPDNPYARQLRNGFRWLRFEKELENEFREFLSWNSLMQRRAAIGVAFLIWTLFIVADWLMVDIRLHPNLFEQLLGVRLGMIGLLLVVWPAAFLPSLRKVGDAIAPYCLLLINLAVLACDVLFEWHGVPRFTQLGATLGILAVFFPLGLAFWACVRLALLCLALNLAVFLLFGGEENLRTNLLNTLYNGLVVLICSFALYLQDYAQREQFLGRRLLGMMAEQDSLTGLVNRRYYELLAQRALEQGAREEKGVALILVDVDDFKAYNDHYGHPAGDAALRQLGVVLRQGARRPLDIAARLGGEEFAVLLYDSEEGNTLAIAERLRQVGDFQRNRLAVDQAHPLDLAHRAALFHPQALGHLRAGRHVAQAVQAVDDLVAHLRHGLAQALQGADVLERLRPSDEGALAVDLEDQPFLLQVAERLAHGDAADVEGLAQLVLRRHAAERRVDAVEDAPAQQLLELAVQRHGRKREQFAHGRIRSSEWLGHLL